LVCPHGWSASPAELPFTLRPGEYRAADVVVKLPPNAGSGLYPLRAQLRVTGDDVPPAWCQVVGSVEFGFNVTPPIWVEPGEWWALVRVGCAGRLVYSPAAKVTVRWPRSDCPAPPPPGTRGADSRKRCD
jgi:hypothetical protein